ncbi:epoxide hydrolase family protein [Actinoallomurus rhizosphaericola]|uniref:epoxide hydrolase family protein n=1 Tax=Actinoallomurus rhizosphaericola TaxID=2952536 RepID=UPI00209323D9|nr:epoxide hydrolase [Actinoallomurus rhizosphaericola]MCO6000110.1 epoxide hydrolase 1 [Actinoallomurus rhizosphaericola]
MSEVKIEPFPVSIPERDLTDLRERLDRVRLPEAETVPDGAQGIGLSRLRSLLDAWRQHDWRALEKRWNAIPHYRTRLDGLGIAFWWVRSPEPDAFPLVLTHGWPGSVLEFEDIIGPLTDPVAHGGSAEDAFDVVVPALPGFGFSARPQEPGWKPGRTARAWADLMTRLGYGRFGAHGGDWGALVSTELARLAPERVAALHLTMPFASPLPEDVATADETEKGMLARRERFMLTGSTHVRVQSVLPQTLGYSLLDSPAGLAAWLSEALVAFSDTRPEAGGGVSVAQQLDDIALYWFTRTGASAARWYWEAARGTPRDAETQNALTVTVPTAFTLFPAEPFPVSRRWAARRYHNLISWNEMEYGGHFAGWEQPGVLVSELRNAFRQVRDH